MGIVAFCPHGHRVKVKDQLAGRKGICPECGARFRIPLASSPEPAGSPAPAVTGRQPAHGIEPVAAGNPSAGTSPSGTPIARVVSLDPTLAASLPRAIPLAMPEGGPSPD